MQRMNNEHGKLPPAIYVQGTKINEILKFELKTK